MLLSPLMAILEIFPAFVPISLLFPSLFLSVFFPLFFYISQESPVFAIGQLHFFYFYLFIYLFLTNDCRGQTVALNEMAPAPNCIPTWGRQAGAEASRAPQ